MKVEQKCAKFFSSQNTLSIAPFIHTKGHRLEQLLNIENRNHRAKNKCFHVSLNPTLKELEVLTKQGIKSEIEAFMKQLGYGNQPYFVYEHADLKRTHYHIVSTRIDVQTGKKINDSNEKRKVSQFIKELEQRHVLCESKAKFEKVQLIPTFKNDNLHEGIQQVFRILNQSNISSRQEYMDILKAFNLELYQSERGQSILIKEQDGQTLRHPLLLSSFNEKPNLEQFNLEPCNENLQQELKHKIERILKELSKEYRFYTKRELRQAFIKNNLMPYSVTKNGNLNIYSPLDKTVVDAQYLLKKNKMRLRQFSLSNDQFYGIIREVTEQLHLCGSNSIEAIVDKKKSILDDSMNREIVFKELGLENCQSYNQIASILTRDEQKVVQKAVQAHLTFIANKAIEKTQGHFESYQETQSRSFWEKVNYQFLREMLRYQNRNDRNCHKRSKEVKRGWNKRRGRRF